VRNFSPHTQFNYVSAGLSVLPRISTNHRTLLGPERIRSYQVYLTDGKKLAPSSILIAVAALRFLYKKSPCTRIERGDIIPPPRSPRNCRRLTPEEVRRFLSCVASSKHRTILTTCYAAGLRISEGRPADTYRHR